MINDTNYCTIILYIRYLEYAKMYNIAYKKNILHTHVPKDIYTDMIVFAKKGFKNTDFYQNHKIQKKYISG